MVDHRIVAGITGIIQGQIKADNHGCPLRRASITAGNADTASAPSATRPASVPSTATVSVASHSASGNRLARSASDTL